MNTQEQPIKRLKAMSEMISPLQDFSFESVNERMSAINYLLYGVELKNENEGDEKYAGAKRNDDVFDPNPTEDEEEMSEKEYNKQEIESHLHPR